jgi:superoxide reductase
MDKRRFIRIAVAGGAGSLFIPRLALAGGGESALATHLAGGVYQTGDAFGRWNNKIADLHLPVAEKHVSNGALQLHVVSHHPMPGYEHYIVKHELLDGNFRFLREHRYDPTRDKTPETTFDLGNYRGIVYAMAICNVHDVWIDMFEV